MPSLYNKTVLKIYFTLCFRENLHLILQIIFKLMKGHFLWHVIKRIFIYKIIIIYQVPGILYNERSDVELNFLILC